MDTDVHCHVNKGPPLGPVLSLKNAVSTRLTLILFSHLRLGLPSGLFYSGLPTKILYAFLICPCVLHASPISSSL